MVDDAFQRLLALRLHSKDGRRSPHKPLLALLALGRLLETGSSRLPWTEAETRLASLVSEFGPASGTSPAQSAAYPFTRMRSDGVWQLDADVPMDNVGPLRSSAASGEFTAAIEAELRADPARAMTTARVLATSHFPESIVPDVLVSVGLDPQLVLSAEGGVPNPDVRRRSAAWRNQVVEAWDRQCAFCGYDGELAGATVGIDAAHVRWWSFEGPDELDNGLALCALHHKLLDRGVLGLDDAMRVNVSERFTARTAAGRALYGLHGHLLQPRPGTALPALEHARWHRAEVFKGSPLAA